MGRNSVQSLRQTERGETRGREHGRLGGGRREGKGREAGALIGEEAERNAKC